MEIHKLGANQACNICKQCLALTNTDVGVFTQECVTDKK